MVKSIIESQSRKKKDFLAYEKELERECMATGAFFEYDWDEYNNDLILKIVEPGEPDEKEKGEIENENDAKNDGTGADNTENRDCENGEGLSDGADPAERGEVVPVCRPDPGASTSGDGWQGV